MAQAAENGQNALVIVESPTKAKTIRKYLGNGFTVEASMGHVRDLPSSAAEMPAEARGKSWSRLAVDIENGFRPVYVVPKDKKKIVTELKKALKGKDVLYLATDEDREGEAIGWHLVQLLKPKVPTHRLVFHEITKTAIQRAIDTPRPLNENVVHAQEARRVLDRLVGYEVSPLLWKKVAPGLSAGRVQSVAVRLLVLKERERLAFVVSAWWDLRAKFERNGTVFDGLLVDVGGTPIATGKDFQDTTGLLKKPEAVRLLAQGDAETLQSRIQSGQFSIKTLDRKVQARRPYPPFTTSTLQQEANRKLGFGAARTMQVVSTPVRERTYYIHANRLGQFIPRRSTSRFGRWSTGGMEKSSSRPRHAFSVRKRRVRRKLTRPFVLRGHRWRPLLNWVSVDPRQSSMI